MSAPRSSRSRRSFARAKLLLACGCLAQAALAAPEPALQGDLTQLSFEKLVEVQRPRGVYIVGLTSDDVDQLYSLRGALEQLALSRAMRVDRSSSPNWPTAFRSISWKKRARLRASTTHSWSAMPNSTPASR